MPIYKRCSRCNKRIPSGSKCGCTDKRYIEEDKYTKDDKYKQFYKSNEWITIKPTAITNTNGIDIYSLYTNGTIEQGSTVHHIIPIKDDWNKRLDINNLIYLTDRNHQLIHSFMRKSKAKYNQITELLFNMFNAYHKSGLNASINDFNKTNRDILI